MTFALIFIIVLSIILLIGAFLIWKSDLPPNDKIVSIIAILALFSLVSIVNEAKKSTYEETKISVAEFERHFFVPPDLELNRIYRLPILDDFKSIIVESLGGWNAEDPNSYEFGLVHSDRKVGKTLTFKEYAKYLQGIRIPSLYVQLKTPNTNIFQFAAALRLSSLSVLDEVVERFNLNGRVPNIFIDNIENAFALEAATETGFPCSVCEYMKSLYDDRKVNVFFITNNSVVKDLLESNEAYNKRMTFFDFKERSIPTLEKYLKDKINHGIKAEEKKFDSNTVGLFVQSLGWDFQILNEYVHNIAAYPNIQHFITSTVDKEAQRISGYTNLQHLLTSIAKLSPTRTNEFIPYAAIRKAVGENPSRRLEEAVRANILIKSHNLYKFRNSITYSAIFKAYGIRDTDL